MSSSRLGSAAQEVFVRTGCRLHCVMLGTGLRLLRMRVLAISACLCLTASSCSISGYGGG
jgi:hypothetical protein